MNLKKLEELIQEAKHELEVKISTSSNRPLTKEEREFFESLRRLMPQFRSVEEMLNRWQELGGTK